MLDELSAETRALLSEARDLDLGAPVGVKSRIWRGLEPQLAVAAAGGVLAPSLVAFAKSAVAATAAVAVGVVGVQLATREPAKPAAVVLTATVRPVASATPAVAPPLAASASTTPRPVRSLAPSRLSEETALLAQVSSALRSGQPARALGLLNDYDRRFSGGELRAERSATRVFAFCAMGRGAQARSEAARFLRSWPRSPLAAQVTNACAEDDALKIRP